ncbi:MAG: cache domain-containing protein [Amphritea sp.]
MFTSFKFKIIALIVLVLAVTSAGIMYFTQRDVGEAMQVAEEASARNVLQLADLNIRAGYDRLISEKVEILAQLKAEMRHTLNLSASVLQEYVALSRSGQLEDIRAREAALRWLRDVKFAGGELLIFGRDGTIIAHTDRELEGASLAGLRDLKGRVLQKAMRDDVLGVKGDTGIFFWQKPGASIGSKYMAHFMPITDWPWTLAVMVNFDDVEQESQKKMEAIVEALSNTFSKIKIASTGYAFLFNGHKKILISPPELQLLPEITTGDLDWTKAALLDEIVQAHEAGEQSIGYSGPYTGGRDVEIFISYFKAFNWYLGVVVPAAEIAAPGKALVARQSQVIGLASMISLIAAFILVFRISRPLNTLASYAKALPAQDFSRDNPDSGVIRDLSTKYRDEVGRLAESFVFMEAAIKENIQQARRDKEFAEQASRAKSDFLATMSHEIRTPMNGVLGMTDLVLESELTTDQRRFMEMIRFSGEGLLAIINDILDFSKIEAGKLQLDNSPINLFELIENQCAVFAAQAEKKGLQLSCQLSPELNCGVMGDVVRIRQVLTNLIGNAIKFTHSGEVVISAIIFDETPDDLSLQIRVRDTGVGISPEHQDVVFDSFSQADSSTTRNFGGTGLGLAISRQLIEMMGGSVDFSSELGKGTTFWFGLCLPKAQGESLPHIVNEPLVKSYSGTVTPVLASATANETNQLQGAVLLVEDHLVNQEYALQSLRSFGLQVDLAGNGEEALLQLEKRRYDLVLMDCQMPVMDGYEATRRIREAEQANDAARLPVIALTANAMKDDRQRCLASGMDDYLSKPFNKTQIRQILSLWLSEEGSKESPFFNTVTEDVAAGGNSDPMPASPLLDETLEQLRGMDADGSFLGRIIDAYLEKSPDDLRQLRAGIDAADSEAVRKAAHSFKSSSYNLGAHRLAELCKELETVGRSADLSSAASLFAAIAAEYQSAMDALNLIKEANHAYGPIE